MAKKKSFKKAFLITFMFLLIVFVHIQVTKPKVSEISLDGFSGRVFEGSKVMPGTFTIEKPFSEALKWGGDAILSYRESVVYKGSKVSVWKPDEKTTGVFLYAEKSFGNFYYFAVFSYENGKIVARPFVNPLTLTLVVVFSALIFLVVSLGSNLYSKKLD